MTATRSALPALSEEQFMKVHEDMAKAFASEFAKALLADVQRVWDDIRRQYQEHNNLLSRQELILQHLMNFSRHAEGVHIGISPRPFEVDSHHQDVTCGVCGTWRSPNANRVDSYHATLPGGMKQLSSNRVGWSVSSAEEDDTGSEACRDTNENDRSRFVIKKASQVEKWVAERLKGEGAFSPRTPARMSPRQAPPLPPKVPPPLRSPRIEDLGPLGVSFQKSDSEMNIHVEEPDSAKMRPSPAKLGSVAEMRETDCNEPRESTSSINVLRKSKEDAPRSSRIDQRKSVNGYNGMAHKLFGDMGMDKTALDQEEYTVEQFYYDTGLAQKVARSDWFQSVTLMVIGVNALYIGYDADRNTADNLAEADIGFKIMENTFCSFFTLEWLIRFGSFRNKLDCFRDMWFKFDTCLVLLMVIETWVLFFVGSGLSVGIPTGLVKLLRLLRLARMARLVRMFPELVAMIKGVRQASRAVGSALLLLVILLYVFSIVIFELLDMHEGHPHAIIQVRFETLFTTLWTLLMDGTFMDNIGYVSRALIEADEWPVICIFMVFVLGSALTVMNMLIGVLCEVVSAVKRAEEEDGQIRMVKDKLLCLLKDLDEDGSGQISKDEIQMVLHNDEALAVLENLNVEIDVFIEQLDMYFEAGEDLSIMQIMDLILVLRQDRQPTMKDILHQQAFMRWELMRDFSQLMKERSAFASMNSSHEANQMGTTSSTLTLGNASNESSPPPSKRLSELVNVKSLRTQSKLKLLGH